MFASLRLLGLVKHLNILQKALSVHLSQRCSALTLSFVVFTDLLQHVAFIVANALDLLVPDIPQSLDEKIKREAYQAQRELEILMAEGGKEELDDDDNFQPV